MPDISVYAPVVRYHFCSRALYYAGPDPTYRGTRRNGLLNIEIERITVSLRPPQYLRRTNPDQLLSPVGGRIEVHVDDIRRTPPHGPRGAFVLPGVYRGQYRR